MSDPDRELLEFAAAHQLILASHAQAPFKLDESAARRRLSSLCARCLLRHDRVFHAQPGHYQITRRGLAAIGSELPVPRYETIRSYRHQIGVAWLWLAAQTGTFGSADAILSERQQRAHDQALPAANPTGDHGNPAPETGDPIDPPLGVRRADSDPRDPAPPHYPDLMLITEHGRIAIELELAAPSCARLEANIAGYGADPDIVAALYLVETRDIGQPIQDAAARLGLSNPTHIQLVQHGGAAPPSIAQ